MPGYSTNMLQPRALPVAPLLEPIPSNANGLPRIFPLLQLEGRALNGVTPFHKATRPPNQNV
jgi:hypothetical protein